MQELRGIVFIVLVGCSATPQDPDPHEEFNRDMTDFNLAVDKNVLKPVAEAYKSATFEPAQRSVSSFISNCKEPYYLVNYSLQGDGEKVLTSFFRFLINTSIGFLGLFDVASELGLEKRDTSYQETLKKWSMPTGDYLVLPILSSSSTRDVIAEPISWFADPVGYIIGWPWMLAKSVVGAVDRRAQNGKMIDATLDNAIDPYLLMRDLYLQQYGELPAEEDEVE